MSVRENIELYGIRSAEELVEILHNEFGAAQHPSQEKALVVENSPFYTPRVSNDHVSILSFNNVPLPDSLIEA